MTTFLTFLMQNILQLLKSALGTGKYGCQTKHGCWRLISPAWRCSISSELVQWRYFPVLGSLRNCVLHGRCSRFLETLIRNLRVDWSLANVEKTQMKLSTVCWQVQLFSKLREILGLC